MEQATPVAGATWLASKTSLRRLNTVFILS